MFLSGQVLFVPRQDKNKTTYICHDTSQLVDTSKNYANSKQVLLIFTGKTKLTTNISSQYINIQPHIAKLSKQQEFNKTYNERTKQLKI